MIPESLASQTGPNDIVAQVLGLDRQDHIRGSCMDATPLEMFSTYLSSATTQALNSSEEWYQTLRSQYDRLGAKFRSTQKRIRPVLNSCNLSST